MGNSNLKDAKKAKNDEFYTQLSDIEKELRHYKDYFKGKSVFCNCDDPQWSNFFKYFASNFTHLGLKKLTTTHFEEDGRSYKLVIENVKGRNATSEDVKQEWLSGDGDFRSPEVVEILKEVDVVVTNPPFSLFREYVAQLMEYNKKFLIIGSNNAVTYKETFKDIKDNNMWIGVTSPKGFSTPGGTMKSVFTYWYTNLNNRKRNEEFILYKSYNDKDYPKYANYDAISVGKVSEIPLDYDGEMGVPITLLNKYNPNQFEIIGSSRELAIKMSVIAEKGTYSQGGPRFYLDNEDGTYKRLFDRIIIKRK